MSIFVRNTWRFALINGAEQAQFGLHFTHPASDALADVVSRYASANGAMWTALRAYLRSSTALTQCLLEEVDIATGNVESSLDVSLPADSGTGGVEGFQMPLQLAPVISLRTGTAGGSGRGRIYLPSPTQIAYDAALPNLTTAYRTAMVNALKDYVVAIRATGAAQGFLGVYSRVNAAATTVNSIDMGSIPDTQRRRRNELVEARISAVIP